MNELLERFQFYCQSAGIDLDSQFDALSEKYRVDLMDVNDKYHIKINIIKNALKGFLVAENQTISDEHLEFVIKFSNLV
jgi:hypothetical protein